MRSVLAAVLAFLTVTGATARAANKVDPAELAKAIDSRLNDRVSVFSVGSFHAASAAQ